MRRISAVCLMLMILAGCAREGPASNTTPTAPQVATSGSDPAQVSQAPSPPPAVPARPIEEDLPVPAPLPDGLRRVDLVHGQAPRVPGLYFMDVATGKLMEDKWRQQRQSTAGASSSLWQFRLFAC